MRRLIAAFVFCGAPLTLATGQPAEAQPPGAPTETVDEREATLRDLEFRSGKLQSGRQQMRESISKMKADPAFDQKLRRIACQSANSTMKAPEFFKYARGKVRFLEKPQNQAQLSLEQSDRLLKVKALLAGLETEPEMDCT